MAKFKVVTPAGASFTVPGAGYDFEMEALGPVEAEIVEIPAGTDEEFVKDARDADALYAKGRPITKRLIDGLERCKVIALGTVGVDSVDVDAATARDLPVTNVPDTFIEEVADHAMTLILATFRRLIVMDRLVREGRGREGRPCCSSIPGSWARPWASSPSVTWRGRWPSARARSACTCWPTTRTSRSWSCPLRRRAGGARRASRALGHRVDARPRDPRGPPHAEEEHFRQMKP